MKSFLSRVPHFTITLFACLVLATSWTAGWAADTAETYIGGLRKVQGEAMVIRGETTMPATNGQHIVLGDVLKTGADGSMGIIFKDNTRLSLGPNSELTMTEYVFNPGKGDFAFFTKMAKGTASYISGSIGKLAPDTVTFETPVATLGVRGTKFLAKVQGED